MTLTPEHREALIKEAVRRAKDVDGTWSIQAAASHTLDLIETGWKPEPKPSKALLAARKAAGKHTLTHILYVNGHGDDMPIVQAALEAYNL